MGNSIRLQGRREGGRGEGKFTSLWIHGTTQEAPKIPSHLLGKEQLVSLYI
jgi:hypothetical protein